MNNYEKSQDDTIQVKKSLWGRIQRVLQLKNIFIDDSQDFIKNLDKTDQKKVVHLDKINL